MYPHLVQFETRKLRLQRELQLLHERERATTKAEAARASVIDLRYQPPLGLALRRQAVGRG